MHDSDLPSITVLIDTYNYAHFVGRAIESALRQEYHGPAPEILVVDDGSTDNTREVVERYGDRVRYLRKANGGQASALNLGVREASGDIICLLDGDDYFYPAKVRLVGEVFRARPEVDLVYNEFDIVDASGHSLEKTYPEPTWTGYHLPLARVPAQLRSLILLGHPWTCITSAMSIRRSRWQELTIPEDVFPHSPDLFLGLTLPFLTEVAIIETAATAYVYHGANVGLFRSSERNRALYARQLACCRRFVEERRGVHFVRYGGRSIYGSEDEGPRSVGGRVKQYLDECRQIAAAEVEPSVKGASQIKLAASLLLPDVLYRALRAVKATYRHRRTRHYRHRIAESRR